MNFNYWYWREFSLKPNEFVEMIHQHSKLYHVYSRCSKCLRGVQYVHSLLRYVLTFYCIIYVHTRISVVARMSVLSWELVPLRLLELFSSPLVWEVCAQEMCGRQVPKKCMGGICPEQILQAGDTQLKSTTLREVCFY